MKATELKAGDLVLYKGKHLITVEEAGYGLCSGSDENGIFHNRIPCEYVHPIPLTEGILEKNGWEKVRINPFYTAYFEYKFAHEEKPTFYKKMQDDAIYHDYFERAQIPFVHQLQHLLWALGFNDNLKI